MILTPENVLQELEKKYNEHKGAFYEDFAIDLSFYMDFAISRKDINLVKAVHDKLISLLMKDSDTYKNFLRKHFGSSRHDDSADKGDQEKCYGTIT